MEWKKKKHKTRYNLHQRNTYIKHKNGIKREKLRWWLADFFPCILSASFLRLYTENWKKCFIRKNVDFMLVFLLMLCNRVYVVSKRPGIDTYTISWYNFFPLALNEFFSEIIEGFLILNGGVETLACSERQKSEFLIRIFWINWDHLRKIREILKTL